jgi:hypothetical protein
VSQGDGDRSRGGRRAVGAAVGRSARQGDVVPAGSADDGYLYSQKARTSRQAPPVRTHSSRAREGAADNPGDSPIADEHPAETMPATMTIIQRRLTIIFSPSRPEPWRVSRQATIDRIAESTLHQLTVCRYGQADAGRLREIALTCTDGSPYH